MVWNLNAADNIIWRRGVCKCEWLSALFTFDSDVPIARFDIWHVDDPVLQLTSYRTGLTLSQVHTSRPTRKGPFGRFMVSSWKVEKAN